MGTPVVAKASVNVGINAQGSQQLVIALLILAGGSLGAGFFFMWHLRSGMIPLLVGGMLVLLAMYCHSKSRPALDRAGAGRTKLTRDDKGLKIETDAITLADPEAAAGLERLLALSHRRPLPAPDGMVRPSLGVDTSAAAVSEAQSLVSTANEKGRTQLRQSLEALSSKDAGAPVIQPRIVEPATTILPDLNSRMLDGDNEQERATG